MQQEKLIEQGLIGVKNYRSFEIHRNAATQKHELRNVPQKCLHYYFYVPHARFGFMHAEIQI